MPQLSLFDTPGSPHPEQLKKQSVSASSSQHKLKLKAQRYAVKLAEHLPITSVIEISKMLARHEVEIIITRKRHTKLGDYRAPHNDNGHRITINHDLNKYSFLLTLVHELAHLETWEKFRRKVKPHGSEWKQVFRELLHPFVEKKIFPGEVVHALNFYLKNPAASSCANPRLLKALRQFDINYGKEKNFHLEEIPENALFTLTGSSKLLRKGKKLRKRYLCAEINSKRKYLVSPVAEVVVRN